MLNDSVDCSPALVLVDQLSSNSEIVRAKAANTLNQAFMVVKWRVLSVLKVVIFVALWVKSST